MTSSDEFIINLSRENTPDGDKLNESLHLRKEDFSLNMSSILERNDDFENQRKSPTLNGSDDNKISVSGFIKKLQDGKLIDKPFEAGNLTIVFASMCAGKSTSAIGYANKMTILGLKSCYVKYGGDYRTGETIASHHDSGKTNLDEKVDVFTSNNIKSIFDKLLQYTVIVIDEGQFFRDIEMVEELVLKHCKLVYIASLDADANLKRMGKVHKLIHLCAPGCLNKIAAMCLDCAREDHRFEPAGYSYSFVGIVSGSEDIGGTEKYIPLCLKHHQRRTEKRGKQ